MRKKREIKMKNRRLLGLSPVNLAIVMGGSLLTVGCYIKYAKS